MTTHLTAEDTAQPGETPWGHGQFIPHSALGYDAVNNTYTGRKVKFPDTGQLQGRSCPLYIS